MHRRARQAPAPSRAQAAGAGELVGQPAWTPPRVLPAHLADRAPPPRADAWCGQDSGRCERSTSPASPSAAIAAQPGVQGLARDPELGGHLLLRFTAFDGQHGAVALLDNGQLDQGQSRPPATPSNQDGEQENRSGPSVKHQVRPERQASAGTRHVEPGPVGEDLLYVFEPALTGRTGGCAAAPPTPSARRAARARPPPRTSSARKKASPGGTAGAVRAATAAGWQREDIAPGGRVALPRSRQIVERGPRAIQGEPARGDP